MWTGHFKLSRLEKPDDNCICSPHLVQALVQWRDLSGRIKQRTQKSGEKEKTAKTKVQSSLLQIL